MDLNIIYNEFKKSIKLDISKKNGIIQENLLSLCSLIIYNIEHTEIIIDNNNYIIGSDDFLFEETLEKSLEKINKNKEDIEKIIIIERKREENGNVIKDNNIIENYNKWYLQYENENYIHFINNQGRQFQNIPDDYAQNNHNRNIIQFPIESLLNNILRIPNYLNIRNQFSNQNNNIVQENQTENDHDESVINIIDKKIDELNNEELKENEEEIQEEVQEQVQEQEEELRDEEEQKNEEEQQNEINFTNNEQLNNIINIFDNYIQNNINNQENYNNNFFNIINRDINYNNFNQFANLTNLVNENTEESNEYDDLPELIPINEDNTNVPLVYNTNAPLVYNTDAPLMYNTNVPLVYSTFLINPIYNNINYDYEDVKIVLNEEQFNNLECKCYKDLNLNEFKECLICIDNFNKEDEIIKIKCNHIFHKNCIKSWLCEESNKCPVCRISIDEGIQK